MRVKMEQRASISVTLRIVLWNTDMSEKSVVKMVQPFPSLLWKLKLILLFISSDCDKRIGIVEERSFSYFRRIKIKTQSIKTSEKAFYCILFNIVRQEMRREITSYGSPQLASNWRHCEDMVIILNQ